MRLTRCLQIEEPITLSREMDTIFLKLKARAGVHKELCVLLFEICIKFFGKIAALVVLVPLKRSFFFAAVFFIFAAAFFFIAAAAAFFFFAAFFIFAAAFFFFAAAAFFFFASDIISITRTESSPGEERWKDAGVVLSVCRYGVLTVVPRVYGNDVINTRKVGNIRFEFGETYLLIARTSAKSNQFDVNVINRKKKNIITRGSLGTFPITSDLVMQLSQRVIFFHLPFLKANVLTCVSADKLASGRSFKSWW